MRTCLLCRLLQGRLQTVHIALDNVGLGNLLVLLHRKRVRPLFEKRRGSWFRNRCGQHRFRTDETKLSCRTYRPILVKEPNTGRIGLAMPRYIQEIAGAWHVPCGIACRGNRVHPVPLWKEKRHHVLSTFEGLFHRRFHMTHMVLGIKRIVGQADTLRIRNTGLQTLVDIGNPLDRGIVGVGVIRFLDRLYL